MSKTRIISFVFGSTALATSMSFVPLADVHAAAAVVEHFSPFDDMSFITGPVKGPQSVLDFGQLVDFPTKLVVPSVEKADLDQSNIGTSFVMLDDSTPLIEDEDKVESHAVVAPKTVGGATLDDIVEAADLSQWCYAQPNLEESGSANSEKTNNYYFTQIERLKAKGWQTQFFGTDVENSGIVFVKPNGKIIVAYHGSDTARNWASDAWLNMAVDSETGGRYHNGILRGFQRTQDQVMAILEQLAEQRGVTLKEMGDDITSTGHSLGGGLAQILADSLRRKGVMTHLITVAAPRVMDVATAKAFDVDMKERSVAVSQPSDPVPLVNMAMLTGASHVGEKLLVPVYKNSWQHKLGGYRVALRAMKGNDGKLASYTFDAHDGHGIGKTTLIGGVVPNPVYVAHKARMLVSEHIENPVHKAAKKYIKDPVVSAVKTGWGKVKGWFGY